MKTDLGLIIKGSPQIQIGHTLLEDENKRSTANGPKPSKNNRLK